MIKTHEVYYPLYEDKEKFIILITGGRGCEDPETPVMMHDLTIKKIKDVKVGDKVMGDDGTPRNVLDVVSGRSMMYEVHQSRGDNYIVNDSHVLCLKDLTNGEVVEIPLFDYMALPSEERDKLVGYSKSFPSEYSEIWVEQLGIGEYCGLRLDGNHRYLAKDGTVKRNSGKSFGVGTFIERLTFELGIDEDSAKRIAHQILYTRYTMVSADISVIPEFWEKVEADGTERYFHKTQKDVINKKTGSRIMFRGIKTSSGNQTAKLKSIHGITTFIVDEAEEWTSEQEFDTIMFSIRQKGLQNRIVIIMNPTDSNHFIYQKYIKDTHKIVEYDGVPVQISTHPNVLHIHTTYLNNIEHVAEQFIKEVKEMKERNPEKYAHVIMGQWADVAEGAVYKKWSIVDSFPQGLKKVARGLDFGFTNDPSACVRCGIDYSKGTRDLYIEEKFYKTGMLIKDLVDELKRDDSFVYADSADPRLIQEIANHGIIIYPVAKTSGSINAGIEGIKDFDNIYITKDSYNMQYEMRNYVWAKDKDGHYLNVPEDHSNHLQDSLRYWYLGGVLGQVVGKLNVNKARLGIY